jgi:hypothetical protein
MLLREVRARRRVTRALLFPKTIFRAEFEVRLAVAMVAARLLMCYWLITGSTSIAKFRNDSCHPR